MTHLVTTKYDSTDIPRWEILKAIVNKDPSHPVVRSRADTSAAKGCPMVLGYDNVWTIFSPETRGSTSFPKSPELGRVFPIPFSLPVLTEKLKTKFNEIRNLPPGWDSYNADPIEEGPIAEAERIVRIGLSEGLSDPWIAPGSDGSVGITWETEKGDIYIDILPDQSPTYAQDLFKEGEEPEESEGEIEHPAHLRYVLRLLVD